MGNPVRNPSNVIHFRGKRPAAPDDHAAEASILAPWHRKPGVVPLTIALLFSLAVHGAVLLWLSDWIIETPERQAAARSWLIHARLVPITVTAAPLPSSEEQPALKARPPETKASPKPALSVMPQPEKAAPTEPPSSPAPVVGSVSQTAPAAAPEKPTAGIAQTAPAAELREETSAESPVAYLDTPPPEYPLSARKQGQQGVVLVRALVNRTGQVEKVSIAKSSGVAALDEAAMNAVQRWSFSPARRGAAPVATWVEVPVRFRLEKEE